MAGSRKAVHERAGVQSANRPGDARLDDEAFWRAHLAPLFDDAEVAALLGLSSRRDVRALAERGELLVVPTSAGRRYPALQFPRGRAEPAIARVIAIMDGVVATPYTTAAWLRDARPALLAGQSPLDWLANGGEPDAMVAAAENAAARLAQ